MGRVGSSRPSDHVAFLVWLAHNECIEDVSEALDKSLTRKRFVH